MAKSARPNGPGEKWSDLRGIRQADARIPACYCAQNMNANVPL